jgi:gluconate 5-dehydrogenase
MAADLDGTSVRVNILLPGGGTAIGMTEGVVADAAKLMSADVMAEPVRWLCSPAADDTHDQRIVATEFRGRLANADSRRS